MSLRRPRLLDLFCGAGGAAMGYHRAGFEVVGVDVLPQKHYPFRFIQADAMTFPLDGYDVIHASPICDDYSAGNHWLRPGQQRITHPRLIAPMRERLIKSGTLWVIENVRLALPDMLHPVLICGTSLGLRVQRHRLFDANIHLFAPGPCRHQVNDVSVRSHRTEFLGAYERCVTKAGKMVSRGRYCPMPQARSAMGIEWMTQEELGEAIPPAYTEWLGHQLMATLGRPVEMHA